MRARTESLRTYLLDFDFRRLFVEGLGWDHYIAEPVSVVANNCEYMLQPVAEKAGFAVFVCEPGEDGTVPTYPIRRKVENQISKLVYEHLIVFVNADRNTQTWQWVKRESGQPPVCREQAFHVGHSGEAILQRLQQIVFTLEDETKDIGISDVWIRVHSAFDVEKITKRFYECFRTELTAFGEFIEGITSQGDRDWYASLMLNRMMFVYFVQKRGFLDNDIDYLRNRLSMVQEQHGGARFQQFYRLFLLRLFHEGLGQPEAQRAPELASLLGNVPFLNGGLFDVHDLERNNPEINIPDRAFSRVFDFFDGYRWHLDERPFREDNEINPDVLGYIFEKYVNQKQMGAYYTKEDITGYITRNTVIPFLFDAANRECPVAFCADGGVWRLLSDDPNRYIYPSVGHGITWNVRQAGGPEPLEARVELPQEIAAAVDSTSKRDGWNDVASDRYALPTETWHEVVARRLRYSEVSEQLASGKVREVNDLITLNLDIERFARDVISQSEGPELLRAFWQAMHKMSVLDPTCGSGAFLFSALNILEPLYTACLEGMRGFLNDLDRTDRPHASNALRDFREILEQVEKHPSERYFILKTIVLNNLYGVDIMEEAVEICKLRLFLKLVAQLRTYDQIEPLPDIDFNIRAGNTLVGFTSLDAVRQAMTVTANGQQRQVFPEDLAALDQIEKHASTASIAFSQFRHQQTMLEGQVNAADKVSLRKKLKGLSTELDRYLATEYGVDPRHDSGYDAWRTSHQPFHWFVEFYEIMQGGGFDVVVGNPPYVSRAKIARSYSPRGFETEACPDIFSMVVERSTSICRLYGRTSMIVPLSLTFHSKCAILRSYLYKECSTIWFSSFGRIPSALFSFDTRVRNTIYLGQKSPESSGQYFTTRLHRWFNAQRPTLFDGLSYSSFSPAAFDGLIPKVGSIQLLRSLESLLQSKNYRLRNDLASRGKGGTLSTLRRLLTTG